MVVAASSSAITYKLTVKDTVETPYAVKNSVNEGGGEFCADDQPVKGISLNSIVPVRNAQSLITEDDTAGQITEVEQGNEDTISVLSEMIDLLEGGQDSFEKGNQVAQLMKTLTATLADDDRLLDEMIYQLNGAESNAVKNALFDMLQSVQNIKIEAIGRKLSEYGERDERLAGLKLLRGQKSVSVNTVELTNKLLQQNRQSDDVELVLEVLDVIPDSIPNEAVAQSTLAELKDYMRHEDEEVRATSFAIYGALTKSVDDLAPVIDALNGNNKLPAMMAIYKSGLVSESLQYKLIETLVNPEEDEQVRAIAAESLKRFSLDGQQFEDYQRGLRALNN